MVFFEILIFGDVELFCYSELCLIYVHHIYTEKVNIQYT